jgi:hypothetical protein
VVRAWARPAKRSLRRARLLWCGQPDSCSQPDDPRPVEAIRALLVGQPPPGAPVQHLVADPMLDGEVIRLDGAIRMSPR